MNDLKSILQMTSNSIEETTALFYQQKLSEGFRKLMPTLNLLTQAIDAIYTYKAEGKELELDTEGLMNTLKDAMHALEEKDTVLLSDILTYEVKDLFDRVLPSL